MAKKLTRKDKIANYSAEGFYFATLFAGILVSPFAAVYWKFKEVINMHRMTKKELQFEL